MPERIPASEPFSHREQNTSRVNGNQEKHGVYIGNWSWTECRTFAPHVANLRWSQPIRFINDTDISGKSQIYIYFLT